MDMTPMKTCKKQIVLGLTIGLIIVVITNAISGFLVIPFPDLRILLIVTAIGAIAFLISVLANDSKDTWTLIFWFGVTLFAFVLGGVFWLVFIPIPDLSLLFLGPWLTFAGIAIAFFAAIPLFNFLTAYKQSKGAASPSLRT